MSMITPELKAHTKRFVNQIVSSVPKGKINYADTIGFLERIMTNQDGIKTLHNAFTRKKNPLYAWKQYLFLVKLKDVLNRLSN